ARGGSWNSHARRERQTPRPDRRDRRRKTGRHLLPGARLSTFWNGFTPKCSRIGSASRVDRAMIRHVFALLFLAALFHCGAAEDFRPRVSEALLRGEKRIVIPPGVYRLDPKSGGELWSLHQVKEVEILAE